MNLKNGPKFESCLRRSLLGEYAAMLGLIYSCGGTSCWLISAADVPTGFIVAFSLVWFFVRCTGSLAGKLWTPIITGFLALALMSVYVSFSPVSQLVWLRIGPLSAFSVSIAMLMMLLVDVVDLTAGIRHRRTVSPEGAAFRSGQ
ncbi:MAG: hypothetical protein JNL58_03550 [Planctomyces sp.]|nr:hypothetical protein [Planctomyces sp.]